jgi:hypothetical protein
MSKGRGISECVCSQTHRHTRRVCERLWGTHLFPHVLEVAVAEVHRQALLDRVERRVELLQVLLRQRQAEVACVYHVDVYITKRDGKRTILDRLILHRPVEMAWWSGT